MKKINLKETPSNFKDFLLFKKSLFENEKIESEIIDLSETNLYKAIPSCVSEQRIDEIHNEKRNFHQNGNIEKSHLIEDWLTINKLPIEYKSHIGFSDGIKSTLSIISENQKNKRWLIPSDVYPYYSDLLLSKGIFYQEYSTLYENYGLPFYFSSEGEELEELKNSDIILITMPLKPSGKSATDIGKNNLKNLISSNPDKTFIIDAVYFNEKSYLITDTIKNESKEDLPYLLELFSLGNVFLLFSLSKNWSLPNVMGINFVPGKHNQILKFFEFIKIDNTSLLKAYIALNLYSHFPEDMYKKQLIARNRLHNIWKNIFGFGFFENSYFHKNPEITIQAGYFYYLHLDVKILAKEGILSLPASTFGGKSGSIISTLALI